MKKFLAGALIGTGAAALVLLIDLVATAWSGGTGLQPLDTIEYKTYDWRLQRTAKPENASTDIVLVEIDEYSLRNLQPLVGRWPWPRVVHSTLIDFIARGKPKVIAYDVNFAEPDATLKFKYGGDEWSGAESDAALVESIQKAGNVILLADATYEATSPGRPIPDYGYRLGAGPPERLMIFPPFGALAGAAKALGHNLFVLDPDGPIRHAVPFVQSGGRYLPSLGVAAALQYSNVPASEVKLDGNNVRYGTRVMPLTSRKVGTARGTQSYSWGLLYFTAPPLLSDLKTRPYRSYSAFNLLDSEERILGATPPTIDPAVFKDKIVFVGATGAGLYDVFETPFSRGKMPGIQIHAALADDILTDRFMRAAPGWSRVALVVAAGLLIGVIATIVPAWYAAGAALVIAAAFLWAATMVFARGLWINVSQPALAAAFALFGGVAYQYFVEGREKRQVKQLFGRYVSRDVYDQLIADPSLAKLGGTRREMTVLFSDIRGFTSVTERGEPEEIVRMLNVYFTRMVEIVFRHHGTVDKFVGDMVMALFGAPVDDPGHAEHAVEAALDMIEELQRLNAAWQAEGRPALDIGVGINTGPMIAGNIGSEAIMSYTVIGDAVNLGSRLESLNKNYGTRIIISEATRSRLPARYAFRPLGEVVVKGKTQPVAIFEVVGRSEAPAV